MSWKKIIDEIYDGISEFPSIGIVFFIMIPGALGFIAGKTESYFWYVSFYIIMLVFSLYTSLRVYKSSIEDIIVGVLLAFLLLFLLAIPYEFGVLFGLDGDPEVFGIIWGR